MQRLVTLIACAALPLAAFAAEAPSITTTEPEVLIARIAAGEAPLILDVRSAEEYEEGHVPGAVNIPHDELALRLDELGPDHTEEIVVYCKSGRRSAIAESILVEAGFTGVNDLDGHWLGWPGEREVPP